METTELFILLPEYKEATDRTGHYLISDELPDENEVNSYIRQIKELNDFFTHEDYQGFYDVRNITAFSFPLEEIEECYPNQKTYLRSVLKEWENWRDEPTQCQQNSFSFHSFPITDDSLCEIARRKIQHPENAYLLINHQAFPCTRPTIEIGCDRTKIQVDTCPIIIKDIAGWFTRSRKPQRVYNWNPKHGENGKGAHPENKGDEVSLLLCSREEADVLLKKAIGIHPQGTLFYYDTNNRHYMEFKMESTNTFHSFHIEDENRIPKVIKNKITYLLSGQEST